MSSINKRLFLVVLLLAIGATTAFAAGPALSLTRDSFGAGETVTINGEGFGRNQSVTLIVSTTNGGGEQVSLMKWEVLANVRGQFVTEFPYDSISSAGSQFRVTATSAKGGTAVIDINAPTANPSGNLDQCANGSFAAPVQCTGANWQNGNVGQNSGHYYEGDTIPYRMVFSNMVPNAANTLTIEWDTTQGGKHAIDYLTSYNRTEVTGNNPCSGTTFNCAVAPATFPIPLDSNVSGAGVTQIGGQVFSLWGGTITSVSAYTLSGSYGGNSSTRITINFTTTGASAVMAWGGHIASRNDWANQGGSASNIPGSPYHMRLIELNGSGGNQDRSLSNVAVRLSSTITITKVALPQTSQGFGFTTTGAGLSNFTLYDDGTPNDATTNTITFNTGLGQGQTVNYTVAENAPINFYQLTGLTCSVGTGGTSTFSTNVPTRTASIALVYGDSVSCTFTNSVVTAADVTTDGFVGTSTGLPIANAYVTITNASTGESQSTRTNSFGRYFFGELTAGDVYIISVQSRKYTFEQSTQTLLLNDSLSDINFYANE